MAAADAVVGAIDAAELAIFLAQKCAEEGPGAAQRKKGERAGWSGARPHPALPLPTAVDRCCSGNALASNSATCCHLLTWQWLVCTLAACLQRWMRGRRR